MKGLIIISRWQTPVGILALGEHDGRLCLCDWTSSAKHPRNLRRLQRCLGAKTQDGFGPVIEQAIIQLKEYFAGERRYFTVPLAMCGTQAQKDAWQEIVMVGYGERLSYSRLAANLGLSKSVRAVANAVASNALSIFVPCHRIVSADGSLAGYAGGLEAKERLLQLESLAKKVIG